MSVVTIVANSAFDITSLAIKVMRELGSSRMSNGTCLPSGVTNRKWAIVGTGFGFCKANETSNGVRVLPSAKYQRRDSLGSGAGGRPVGQVGDGVGRARWHPEAQAGHRAAHVQNARAIARVGGAHFVGIRA